MSREWIMMNGTRFWDGNRWVNEYPDAARYSVTRGEQLLASAKKINATSIVADYGLSTEKRVSVPWTSVVLDTDETDMRFSLMTDDGKDEVIFTDVKIDNSYISAYGKLVRGKLPKDLGVGESCVKEYALSGQRPTTYKIVRIA